MVLMELILKTFSFSKHYIIQYNERFEWSEFKRSILSNEYY